MIMQWKFPHDASSIYWLQLKAFLSLFNILQKKGLKGPEMTTKRGARMFQ